MYTDISIVDKKSDINTILEQETGDGESETQPQDDGDGAPYRRRLGRFTRSLVGQSDSADKRDDGDYDWNEWAGYFHVFAKKPEV